MGRQKDYCFTDSNITLRVVHKVLFYQIYGKNCNWLHIHFYLALQQIQQYFLLLHNTLRIWYSLIHVNTHGFVCNLKNATAVIPLTKTPNNHTQHSGLETL